MRAHILIEREDGSVRHTILDHLTESSLTIQDGPASAEGMQPIRAWLESAQIVSTFDYPGVPDEPDGAARVKPVVTWERIEPRERTPEEEAAIAQAAAEARARLAAETS